MGIARQIDFVDDLIGGSRRSTIVHNGTNYRERPLAVFDVRDYGAIGNNPSIDTQAFQDCFGEAGEVDSEVEIPDSPSGDPYLIDDTVAIEHPTDDQVFLSIKSSGDNSHIRWQGGNDKAVFQAKGWKYSTIHGVKILVDGYHGVKVWDLLTDVDHESTAELKFENQLVAFTGGATDCIAYNGAALAGSTVGDISVVTWINALVSGSDPANRNQGWTNRSPNGTGWTLVNCGGYYLETAYNEVGGYTLTSAAITDSQPTIPVADTARFPRSGRIQILHGAGDEYVTYTGKTATSFTGCTRGANGTTSRAAVSDEVGVIDADTTLEPGNGGGVTFLGMVNSHCGRDFQFGASRSPRAILGGRFEVGDYFIVTGQFGSSSANYVTVHGANVADYAASGGTVIQLGLGDHLTLNTCTFDRILDAGTYDANFITASVPSSAWGSIDIRGTFIQGSGPFWTVPTNGKWRVPDPHIIEGTEINSVTGFYTTGNGV